MKKSTEGMAPLFEPPARIDDKRPDNVQPPAEAGTRSGELDKRSDIGADGRKVDPIEESVGALFDPIIVYPAGGWENDLPEPLKKELPLHRMAHNMLCIRGKASWDEACDVEALLYLYPASLAAPMGHDWTQIYLYLGYKVMGSRMPEDVAQKTLTNYEMGMLRDLKRWIQRKKLEARKARRRQEKAEKPAKQQAVEAEYEQMKMV